MSTQTGVRLESDGRLQGGVAIRRGAGEALRLDRGAELHVHLRQAQHNVCLVSPVSIRATFDSGRVPCAFELPVPLNAYVYPEPTYVMRADGGSLTASELEQLFDDLRKVGGAAADAHEAAYDVPPILPIEEVADEAPEAAEDDEVSEEEDDFGEDSEEASETGSLDEQDDDEEWVPSATDIVPEG